MRKLLLIAALGTAVSVFSQKMDCSKFRNGTFRLQAEEGTTIITRNGNFQTEKMEGKKDEAKLYVKWIDDCTYTLKPTKKTLKRYGGRVPKNAELKVVIIEVKENSYIQTSTSNFSDIKVTSEVTKIN